MLNGLARNWELVALRGVAALALLFGAYALVNGAFNIAEAVANRRGEAFGVLLIALGLRLRSWGRAHPADGTFRTA